MPSKPVLYFRVLPRDESSRFAPCFALKLLAAPALAATPLDYLRGFGPENEPVTREGDAERAELCSRSWAPQM